MPDFPKPGILFKDITPVCADADAFREFIDHVASRYRPLAPTAVVAVDARGFVIGGALAYALGTGVVLVRKEGKLPAHTHSISYDLEYGSATLEIHRDALGKGDRVLVVDDLLATGGTIAAAVALCRRLGAEVLACAFMVELAFLKGRDKLPGVPVYAPLRVEGP